MMRPGSLLFCLVVILMPFEVHAGRPVRIDDADPVGFREFEIEAGITYLEEDICRHWDFPFGLNYGIAPRVEISCGFGGQFEELSEDVSGVHHENGLCDFVLGSKVSVVNEGAWLPRQALSATVKFPVADEEKGLGSGETDYDLMWIASKNLNSKVGAHVNFGYSWIGKETGMDVGDLFHYGVGMDLQICDQWQWLGEVFWEKQLVGGSETLLQCNIGMRWEAMEGLVLDAAAGTKIHGDAPEIVATAGLTWAFGGGE